MRLTVLELPRSSVEGRSTLSSQQNPSIWWQKILQFVGRKSSNLLKENNLVYYIYYFYTKQSTNKKIKKIAAIPELNKGIKFNI